MTEARAGQPPFAIAGRRVLLCSCGGTMPLRPEAVSRLAIAAGMVAEEEAAPPAIAQALCQMPPDALRRLGEGEAPPLIACGQEVAALRAAWTAAGAAGEPLFADIRDAGGWSAEAAQATPKILALLAAALVEPPSPDLLAAGPARSAVVLGRGQEALEAATRLAESLEVTLVLEAAAGLLLPARRACRILRGRLRGASGAIGRFHLDIAGLAALAPWARSADDVTEAADAGLAADLVLDLRGAAAPFPAERLGWVRADPDRPGAVAGALLALLDMAGEIAVPRAVATRRERCVHAAGGRVQCTRCLSVCPTGALRSDGAAVTLDPLVCGGCGGCAAVCPTGALRYAAPPLATTLRRIAVALGVHRMAGGPPPVLLLHGGGAEAEILAALARSGPGLPAAVLPLAVEHPTQFGVEPLLAIIALGARRVVLWNASPEAAAEGAGLAAALRMAEDMLAALGLGRGRLALCDAAAPEGLLAALAPAPGVAAVAAMEAFEPEAPGAARLRASLDHLRVQAGLDDGAVALPAGAPCGGLDVSAACTLCLACTRACPTEALQGDPRAQRLTFQESACVQCGLCAAICPEGAIALRPRIAGPEAGLRRVLAEDEVALCAVCGRPVGGRRAIEGVIARLRGLSPALGEQDLARLYRCDACRLEA